MVKRQAFIYSPVPLLKVVIYSAYLNHYDDCFRPVSIFAALRKQLGVWGEDPRGSECRPQATDENEEGQHSLWQEAVWTLRCR